jgi:glycosyltransferase involved in cell wall biosynthesis
LEQEAAKGLTVVIPAYNEEKGIQGVVDRVLSVLETSNTPFEIIVVDDGSKDRTVASLRDKSVKVLRHELNRGYGAALKTGIQGARYGHVAILDADGTYEERDLPKLMEHMDTYDMVVGARTGKGAKIPLIRRPAKWILNLLANFLTETRIPDLNSGFRIFDKRVAKKFFNILPDSFSFTSTLTMALLTNGYSIKYIPSGYKRRKGRSKIRPIHDTVNFFALIVRTALYFAPLKIFIPLSLSMIGLSLLKMIVIDIMLIQNMTDSTLFLFLAGIQVGMLGMLADLIDKRSPPSGKDD